MQRKTLADVGPTVIWIRLPNTRRRALLAWFETALPDILAALERGEPLIEVHEKLAPRAPPGRAIFEEI